MIATLKVTPRNRLAGGGNDLIQSLRRLDASLGKGVSKHDRAIALISACIDQGINTLRHIIGVLRQLDFKPAHIAITLKANAGSNPDGSHWKLNDSGVYQLHV